MSTRNEFDRVAEDRFTRKVFIGAVIVSFIMIGSMIQCVSCMG